MRASRYFQLAHSAAKCEEFGNLSEAAVLWHRANVCEARLRLAEGKSSRRKIGGAA